MEKNVFDLLNKCNAAYSEGDVYQLTDDDWYTLANEFDIYEEDVGVSLVDDFLYDTIYEKAKQKYPSNPFFKKLTSNNTGYGVDIIHEIPMGSMEELKEGDFTKWKGNHKRFLLSDKLDGCSVILTYVDGKLHTAATRGKGLKGKDISRHLTRMKTIPQTINYKDKLIVRGEILFHKAMIDWVLKGIEEETGKKQKNGRNTISGLLNKKESSEWKLADAHFVTYWTNVNLGNSFELLESLGFETAYNHIIYSEYTDDNGNEVKLSDEVLTNFVKTRKKESLYELDGIILTQLDNVEDGFETGTINPKASRKYKVGIYDNMAESVVTNINWQISRHGIFTPVLEIEPVEVAGCKVTNITAHNYENVIKSKCGIGARIKFIRAGLVIPKLEEVIETSEDFNLPNCKTQVKGVDLEYIWSEGSGEYYREKGIRILEYFGKKLEVEQLGYGNCAKIYDEFASINLHAHPEQIFELVDGRIANLIGENGKKIEASLQSKKQALSEVKWAAACSAFGPDMGERVLQLVWDKYGTLEKMTKEKLEVIDGFGDSRIEQYLEYQDEWYITKVHMQLANYGITFVDPNVKESNACEGYVVCFSGVRDKEFAEFINKNGGEASDNWKKTTNILVVKDKNATSNKITKAKEKGIDILTLDEAKERFKCQVA